MEIVVEYLSGRMCLFNVIYILSSLRKVQTLAQPICCVLYEKYWCQKWGKPVGFAVFSV